MKYLLDTQTLLWISTDDEQLTEKVKFIFLNELNTIYVSMVSIWEISQKVEEGKLYLGESLKEFLQTKVINNKIELLSIEPKHFYHLEKLPKHHKSQFNRLLVSQSIVEKIPIITKNEDFAKYAVERVWN